MVSRLLNVGRPRCRREIDNHCGEFGGTAPEKVKHERRFRGPEGQRY